MAIVVLAAVVMQPWGGEPSAATPPRATARATTPAPPPTPAPARAAAPITASPAAQAPDSLPALRPNLLVLPSGRRVPVVAVGTTGGGELDVPADIRDAGWWRGGAHLGDPFGAMVLAAHVDSFTQGLGPFVELLTAKPGSRFTVSTGTTKQSFRLDSRTLIRRLSMPRHAALFSPGGHARLVLITCAPPYIPSRDGYQDLAVLTAYPTGPAIRTAR